MFTVYRDSDHQKRLDQILEGKSTRQKLTKVDLKFPVEELPGDDIEDVYGCYSGHADDLLNVLNDIENQLNKGKEEATQTFKTSTKEFIADMGEQKAFIFAYKNKEGLNASLYTTQVEFNNACRAKKRSIRAAGEFADAFEKHVCSCNSLLKDFGNLDDKKLGILSDVMDKILGDEKMGCNKSELGKLFDAMAARCLGRIPHEDEKPKDEAEETTTDTTQGENQNEVVSTTTEEIAQQQEVAAETATENVEEPTAELTPTQKVEAAQRSAMAFYQRMKKFYE